jgi:adenylosuccinate lyase
MANLNRLRAICPIDGRYSNKTRIMEDYFSEFALNKYRIKVEIEYLIKLCNVGEIQLQKLDNHDRYFLKNIYNDFTLDDCEHLKETEKKINHDVKAVEYFIREKIRDRFPKLENYVHFALTSQDINSSANMLSIKDAISDVIVPIIDILKTRLSKLSSEWSNITLLARTHGQPASPTTLGKEFKVFHERLYNQYSELHYIKFRTKFGGATGNFNAHYVAYPHVKWDIFSDDFISHLDLKRNKYTTQIDHYDNYSEIFDVLKRINTILIDLCGDIWLYISQNILIQRVNPDEVGSSAMPHKVNPINFENAEGNFLLANNLFEFFSRKLPVSRLQRDLTDSTILRNVGVAFSYMTIGLRSLIEGLSKITPNRDIIDRELNDNYVVIAEAIQTLLKVWGYENSYESLKDLTRTNTIINKEVFDQFIDNLEIDLEKKQRLKQITPLNYTGRP